MKKFNEFIFESIRDKMKGKSDEEIIKSLKGNPDVVFKRKQYGVSGTFLIGEIFIDFDTLVKIFGMPTDVNGIVQHFEWTLVHESGRPVIIYDINSGLDAIDLMTKEYKWHIGGVNVDDANDLIAYIYKNKIKLK